MKKELKDYLHLYLGCEVVIRDYATAKIVGINRDMFYVEGKPHNHFYISKGVKPILRPLSDMTDEENGIYNKLFRSNIPLPIVDAERTRFLLSKHFDLFGLTESGLAIDATAIKEVK